jgi:hypothetical protein
MSAQKDELDPLLAAIRALRSDDPTIRRPAISMLLNLARQGQGRSGRVLTEEFGPYAPSEDLSGCSAPIETVHGCDGNCRSCVWLWLDRPSSILAAPIASSRGALIHSRQHPSAGAPARQQSLRIAFSRS